MYEIIEWGVLLFLGLITACEDWKYHKIRNIWTGTGIVFGLICNFLHFSFFQVLGMFLLFLIIGMGLWYVNVWSGGDGKLFIMYCLLLMGLLPSLDPFLPLTLLVNVFLPCFLFLLVKLIFHPPNLTFLKSSLQSEGYFRFFLPLSFFALLRIILFVFHFHLDYLFRLVIVFLLYKISETLIKERVNLFGIILFILTYTIGIVFSIFTLYYFLFSIFISILFVFGERIISILSYEVYSIELPVNKLKPGVHLADVVYKEKNTWKKSPRFSGLEKRFENKQLFTSSILKKEDIEKLKKTGIKHLRVYQTTHFAFWFLIGAILTGILKENIFIYTFHLLY